MALNFKSNGFLAEINTDLFNNQELLSLRDEIEGERKRIYGPWLNCQGSLHMNSQAKRCQNVVRYRIYHAAGFLTGLPVFAVGYIQAGTKACAEANI